MSDNKKNLNFFTLDKESGFKTHKTKNIPLPLLDSISDTPTSNCLESSEYLHL